MDQKELLKRIETAENYSNLLLDSLAEIKKFMSEEPEKANRRKLTKNELNELIVNRKKNLVK